MTETSTLGDAGLDMLGPTGIALLPVQQLQEDAALNRATSRR